MSTTSFGFVLETSAPAQLVIGPEGIEIILVNGGFDFIAFLNNCPDETLPLNKPSDDCIPITPAGELVCSHHVAKFDACNGCLLANGKARHIDRLKAGLFSIPVNYDLDLDSGNHYGTVYIAFELSDEVMVEWRRIKAFRHRKSFGRGPVGFARYLLSRLTPADHAG